MRSRFNQPWSLSEDEWLTRMAASGAKVPRISQCLRRTTRSIRRRAEVLKISWKAAKSHYPRPTQRKGLAAARWQAEEETLLREMILVGQKEDAIAMALQRTVLAVRNRMYAVKRSETSKREGVIEPA